MAALESELKELQPRDEFRRFSSGLYPQFAAVVAGLRPGMDLWVGAGDAKDFSEFARSRGLIVQPDIAFRRIPPEDGQSIVGYDQLTTTFARGVRLSEASDSDEIHFFLGRSERSVRELRSTGWYPVVAAGRVHTKPTIDNVDFGLALGYPECCIRFFSEENDWARTNSYARTLLSTRGENDHRTNCFGKSRNFSLIFHIPCSFQCERSIRFADQLGAFLTEHEPEFLSKCRKLLRMPIFTTNERECVILDAEIDRPGHVVYRDVASLTPQSAALVVALKTGDSLEVRGRFTIIRKGTETTGVIESRCDGFAPKVPLVLWWT